MNDKLALFMEHFENQDKKACVLLCRDWLESGDMEVRYLYEHILRAALDNMTCSRTERQCIWMEHVSTAIVRTILEIAYPYVMKERDALGYKDSMGRVLVLCPDGEYHEIGARMIADYFTLLGFEAVFVGSSTPREDLLDAIHVIAPALIAVSVTNFYNLVAAKKLISEIHTKASGVPVIAGGRAFESNMHIASEIGADLLVESFEDLQSAALLKRKEDEK